MNSRRFNMFHHAHHMKLFSVKNSINFCFLATI